MIGALGWIGARARWVLVIGAFAGLAAPDISAFLRPALPVFVALVYALAMLRVDLGAALSAYRGPRAMAWGALTIAVMLIGAPVAAYAFAAALGAEEGVLTALVYTFAAPPIASAAALCLIIGYSGGRALALTVLASLAMPFTGPLVAEALLGAALDVSPVALALRMAAMIGGGFAAAWVGRRLIGADRIARNTAALDGVAALGFLLFILPLFDGMRAAILAAPLMAAWFLALACLIIFGVGYACRRVARDEAEGGALGVVMGARSVGLFLAALPPDPVFALYVALYQFPMAAVPLFMRRRG